MADESARRYVLTFKDSRLDGADLAQLLQRPAEHVRDGVAAMISERSLQASDILHFARLGEAAATLSPREADELRRLTSVVEVVEDFEVRALSNSPTDGYFNTGSLQPDRDLAHELERRREEAFARGYQAALDEVFASLSPARRAALRLTPRAAGTQRSPTLPKSPPLGIPLPKQPIPWNIHAVRAPGAWSRCTGTGARVAVIDSGIAQHADLAVAGGVSTVPGVVSFLDNYGHGTHCAGIIAARNNPIGVVGVAPDCKLFAVKALNDTGAGQLSWVLAAMNWVLQNDMDAALLALGSPQPTVLAYTNAIAQLLAAGCLTVAPAGHGNGTAFPGVYAPANSPGAIAVGSVDQNLQITPWSSRGGAGNPVTLVAPGASIKSTHLNNGYQVWSGSSAAASHVAGAVALMRQRHPNFTAQQIRTRLLSGARDLGAPGNDPTYGAGLLDCNASTF